MFLRASVEDARKDIDRKRQAVVAAASVASANNTAGGRAPSGASRMAAAGASALGSSMSSPGRGADASAASGMPSVYASLTREEREGVLASLLAQEAVLSALQVRREVLCVVALQHLTLSAFPYAAAHCLSRNWPPVQRQRRPRPRRHCQQHWARRHWPARQPGRGRGARDPQGQLCWTSAARRPLWARAGISAAAAATSRGWQRLCAPPQHSGELSVWPPRERQWWRRGTHHCACA